MKYIILALISGVLVAAAPQPEGKAFGGLSAGAQLSAYPGGSSGQSCEGFNLTASEADTIVQKYASILRQQPYDGKSPNQTAMEIISPDYEDQSDSIHSLLHLPLNGALEDDNRTEWVDNIAMASHFKPPPYAQLEITRILRADDNVILWTWTLEDVGSGEYPVKGIQLLYVDCNKQVSGSYFEFNSLAWAADTQQVKAYCSD